MANISDGGKGIPHDPPNAKMNTTNDLSTTTPAAHSAKNDQFLTEIDQVMTKYSTTRPPVDTTNSLFKTTTISPKTTDNTRLDNTTVTTTDPSIRQAKNDKILTDIAKVSTNYSTTCCPPVDIDQHNSLYTTATTIPPRTTGHTGTDNIAVTTTDPSIYQPSQEL